MRKSAGDNNQESKPVEGTLTPTMSAGPTALEDPTSDEESVHAISDRFGRVYRLTNRTFGRVWKITVWDEAVPVGMALCVRQTQESLLLSDIQVYCSVALPRPWWHVLLRLQPERRSYRGRGIGTAMLQFIIGQARREAVQEIEGNLLPLCLREMPNLTDWYRGCGFLVHMNEDGCSGAILLNLSRGKNIVGGRG